jgi:hypothetical protein
VVLAVPDPDLKVAVRDGARPVRGADVARALGVGRVSLVAREGRRRVLAAVAAIGVGDVGEDLLEVIAVSAGGRGGAAAEAAGGALAHGSSSMPAGRRGRPSERPHAAVTGCNAVVSIASRLAVAAVTPLRGLDNGARLA